MTLPPAVVLGLSPTGLHAIRALGRAGVPVYGLDSTHRAGAASRYLTGLCIEPDPERRLSWLRERFATTPRIVLLPCSDQDIDLVLGWQNALGPRFALPHSYRSGLAAEIMDKARFHALCTRHGVAVPQTVTGTMAELLAHTELRYPLFVKPATLHRVKAEMAGKKGWIAGDPGELHGHLRAAPAGADRFVAQEIIGGPESDISLYCGYFDGQGRAHQGFTARKLRQYPPGFGSASLVQSAPDPATKAQAEAFLSAIGYRGIAACEYKRDPRSGALMMIEINVRPSLWFSVSGGGVVRAAYHDLAQTGQEEPEAPQTNGLRWHYGLKDTASALFYARHRRFVLPRPQIETAGPATAHMHAVWEADDWRPSLAEAGTLMRRATHRLGGSHAR